MSPPAGTGILRPMSLVDAGLVLAAYLLGSVSSAIVACRLMGLPDPRNQGSGNPGATNVLRVGGRTAAAVTLAGDMGKGLVPVAAARLLGAPETVVAATAAAAFLGHLYPVFFGFRGGKGVATLLGTLLPLSWPAGLLTPATWLLAAKLFHISSLSALIATALAPAYVWFFTRSPVLTATVAGMGVLLYWRHRDNIRRLLRGEEGRIGDKG